MRSYLLAALAAAVIGLIGAGPASAARDCKGSDQACSGPSIGHKVSGQRASGYKASGRKTYARHYQGRKVALRKGSKRIAQARKRQPNTWTAFDAPVRTKKARYAKRARSYASSGSYSSSGVASYYWQRQRVASGGWFNPSAMTAAHKTLPFGTMVRVTHMGSGRSVVVRINDRGPYVRGRIIDLSSAAAGVIGMKGSGVARVSIAVIGS